MSKLSFKKAKIPSDNKVNSTYNMQDCKLRSIDSLEKTLTTNENISLN